MSVIAPTLTLVVGAVLGAWLARRNEKRAATERLLLDTLSDLVDAIAAVVAGDDGAQRRYASATARLALHASPEVVAAFRRFQDDATTATVEGRERFLAAVAAARRVLGAEEADTDDLAVLLWGTRPLPSPALQGTRD